MGKKRGHLDVEDVLHRPWCYYCERDFEDLKLLISHQKAKHFKCDRCGRRLNTAGGLSVHLNQVHKETLNQVENALPNRQGLEVEIFGMEGMPQEALDQHRNRIIQNFYQAQEDRRVATGNPLPGGAGHARKKLKVETAQELLARFAEFRVRKKAAAAAGGGAMEGVVAANGDAQQYNGEFQQPPATYAQQPYGYAADPVPAQPTSNPAAATGLPQRLPQTGGAPAAGDDIDQMIRMAEAGIKPSPAKPAEAEDAGDRRAGKKEKDKKGRMVYDDVDVSPEERMAALPRYVFQPEVGA